MKSKSKFIILEQIKETAFKAYRSVLQTLSIMAVIMVLIAIILASYGEYIAVHLLGSSTEHYAKIILFAVIIYIIVAIIMVAINFSFLSNKKHDSLLEKVDCSQERCKRHEIFLSEMTDKNNKALQTLMKTLSSSWANTKFAECVILNEQLDLIESSVVNNGTIYIFTSDFTLENEIIDIIVENLQKGITYKYIIPNIPSKKNEFNIIVKSWFEKFLEPIHNKQISSLLIEKPKFLNTKLKDIIINVVENKNPDDEFMHTQKKRIKELFIKQLPVYAVDAKYFYTTCALYQDNIGNTETAFIKLPSGKNGGLYVAFLIPTALGEQRREFIRRIEDFCEEEKKYTLPNYIFGF